MYLLYSEYQNMGGTLDETTFNDVDFEAEARVDWYTFGRLKQELEIPEAVKRCVYYLIKLISDKRNTTGIGTDEGASGTTSTVASQSNDGVSISYNVLSVRDAAELIDTQIKQTIQMYLQDVTNSLGQKLLYRGLYKGE